MWHIYKDAATAHWQKNPEVYTIVKGLVESTTTLTIPLMDGGGCAISIIPATAAELKQLKKIKEL